MAGYGRGALLAQTFQLPQPVQPTPTIPRPFQDEIGDPMQGLQQIDGVTGEYFDKWASLKGFARDVWENYGLDVRYPDPSVPESTKLHRIYLKAVADLKKQGERLKTGQKMYEGALGRGDIINIDPNKQSFADAVPMNDFMPNELDPIVTEANNKLQQLYFGNAIGEAKQYYEQIKSRLEDLRDNDPQQAKYWQRQLDALTPPTKAVREFDPNRNQVNKGRTNAAGQLLRKFSNMIRGTADGYKLSPDEFGPNGERIWVNKDFERGITFGNAEVVEWQYIPTTKQTFLKVRRFNPQTQQYMPDKVELSGQDAVSLAKTFVSENPRFGAAGEYIDQFADQNGYFSDTGEVNPDVLMTPDSDKIYEKMLKEENADKSKKEKAKIKTILGKLDSMSPGLLRDDREVFKGKDGRDINIVVRENDKGNGVVWEIENVKELFPGLKKDQYKKYKTLSKDAVRNFLINSGVLETMKESTGTPVAPNTSAPVKDRKDIL